MSDQEIADMLVRAGIVYFENFDECYFIAAKRHSRSSEDIPAARVAEWLVHDWRVAGRCLEERGATRLPHGPNPRAINEASAIALLEQDSGDG